MKGAFFNTLPVEATDIAARVDALYIFLTALSAVVFVGVIGAILYFAIRYRAGRGHMTKPISHSTALEIFWTAIPTVIFLGIFAWGWVVYRDMVTAPGNAITVRVLAQQWRWTFQYENGITQDNNLVVPVNRPVKLVMSSSDVLHSFFVPNFRIKSDVVPGMYTSVWFEPKVLGDHQVFCTEYCGGSPAILGKNTVSPYGAHSTMYAMVRVVDGATWDRFLLGQKLAFEPPPYEKAATEAGAQARRDDTSLKLVSLSKQGAMLVEAKGCVSCHSADGSTGPGKGPSFKGLFGSSRNFTDGTHMVADENYLRNSILMAQAKVVKGYENLSMPPYQGVVKETEVNALVEYIKALR